MVIIRTVIARTTTTPTVTAAAAAIAAAAAAAAIAKRTHELMLGVTVNNGHAQQLCFPHGLNLLLLLQPTRTFK